MKKIGLFLVNTFLFIQVLFIPAVFSQVIVEPFGTAVLIDEELEVELLFDLMNTGDAEVNFEIDIDELEIINPEDERDKTRRSIRNIRRPVAPRRDLDSRGILIHERCGWYDWDFEQYFEAIDDFDYDRFRSWDQVQDVDFTDYDIMWIGNHETDDWIVQSNENLERVEEFVNNGGALYRSSGTNDHEVQPVNPGGLVYEVTEGENECPLQVNPEDNWLINLMNETDQYGWEWRAGQRLFGFGCASGCFTQAAIDEIENSDFHQVIALGNPTEEPIIVVYGFGRGFVIATTTVDGYLHHSPHIFHWGRTGIAVILYLDFLANMRRWIDIEPKEGLLEPGGGVDLNVVLMAEEMEVGTHHAILEIQSDDPDQQVLEIPIMMSINAPVFDLLGVVVDETNGETLDQVTVSTDPYDLRRHTNDDGEIEILNLPSNDYDVHLSLSDYLPQVLSFEAGDNDVINLEVSMLHAQCNMDIEEVVDQLPVDGQSEIVVTVSNDGNGPLTYNTEKRLLGDANAVPWDIRVAVPAGVLARDSRIQGAVFDGDNFYLSGANDRDPVIYILNRDQEVIDQFGQLGEGRYGYKDLSFDGEVIWGSGERAIYGFTTAGEEVTSFDSGISPCNNLAWDSDRDILWGSGTTTNIFGYDREGNQIAEVGRHDLRVYGLAYWTDDPDGYQLYAFHKINEVGDLMIAKIDVENNRMIDVANLEHEAGGEAQGCFITNQYDIYSWVFMGIANNGAEDRIDIWQIDARKDWMAIDPTEGVIEPGDEQDFVVTLDAEEQPQALLEGDIVFLHDGVGGETHLPVSLQVVGGGEPEEMVLDLNGGWNMVSSFVQPDPDDVVDITVGLVEAGTLIMMKNSAGQFYNPEFGFNNIAGWGVDEGYMMKMDGADELTLIGEAVPWNQAIPLEEGWQIVSYYPRQGVDAIFALSGIGDVLIMAKDCQGRFYNPAFNFSNMGDMIPGQGYLLNLEEATELVYNIREELAGYSTSYIPPGNLQIHENTGENMSLLVLSEISEGEVGVFANGVLVGSGIVQNGMSGIAVWGDDLTTDVIDGASRNQVLELRLYSETGEVKEFESITIAGSGRYNPDGFWAVKIDGMTTPEEFGITSVFPNPFNDVTNIKYSLPDNQSITLELYNAKGQLIDVVLEGQIKAGQHVITWDASDFPSGVYMLKMDGLSSIQTRKVLLIR